MFGMRGTRRGRGRGRGYGPPFRMDNDLNSAHGQGFPYSASYNDPYAHNDGYAQHNRWYDHDDDDNRWKGYGQNASNNPFSSYDDNRYGAKNDGYGVQTTRYEDRNSSYQGQDSRYDDQMSRHSSHSLSNRAYGERYDYDDVHSERRYGSYDPYRQLERPRSDTGYDRDPYPSVQDDISREPYRRGRGRGRRNVSQQHNNYTSAKKGSAKADRDFVPGRVIGEEEGWEKAPSQEEVIRGIDPNFGFETGASLSRDNSDGGADVGADYTRAVPHHTVADHNTPHAEPEQPKRENVSEIVSEIVAQMKFPRRLPIEDPVEKFNTDVREATTRPAAVAKPIAVVRDTTEENVNPPLHTDTVASTGPSRQPNGAVSGDQPFPDTPSVAPPSTACGLSYAQSPSTRVQTVESTTQLAQTPVTEPPAKVVQHPPQIVEGSLQRSAPSAPHPLQAVGGSLQGSSAAIQHATKEIAVNVQQSEEGKLETLSQESQVTTTTADSIQATPPVQSHRPQTRVPSPVPNGLGESGNTSPSGTPQGVNTVTGNPGPSLTPSAGSAPRAPVSEGSSEPELRQKPRPSAKYVNGVAEAASEEDIDLTRYDVGGVEQEMSEQGLSSEILDAVVKIYATHCDPNYSLPWQMRRQTQSTSSGFVIPGRHILTNAHSVEHYTVVRVKKRAGDQKYIARVLATGNECDLALLTVMDEEFWQGLKPLSFGALPALQASVIVVGYPIGGENISVTAGVVSRVEIQDYTHGASQLLGIQIDAAINSGSSGGPALNQRNEVVGIAFQSLNTGDSENIGYLVAESVVSHFLRDYEKNGRYTGFCHCGFQWQRMENISLRRSMNMKDDDSGILVRRVNKTSPALEVLRQGDIITSIDDTSISNAGTVPYRSGERISFHYIITTKFTGDPVRLRILRDGKYLNIEYELRESSENLLVPVHEHRRQPEYFTIAGLVFVALSEPYLAAEYGDKWDLKAPVRLLERLMYGSKETKDEQVVVLSQVLNAEINIGYEYLINTRVHKFNGERLRNLAHLARLVDACTEDYLRFDLDDEIVVVGREEAIKASKEILETHCIPSAYSIGDLPSQGEYEGNLKEVAKGTGTAAGGEQGNSAQSDERVENGEVAQETQGFADKDRNVNR